MTKIFPGPRDLKNLKHKNNEETTQTCIINKLLKTGNKETILKAAREERHYTKRHKDKCASTFIFWSSASEKTAEESL